MPINALTVGQISACWLADYVFSFNNLRHFRFYTIGFGLLRNFSRLRTDNLSMPRGLKPKDIIGNFAIQLQVAVTGHTIIA